MVSPRVSGRTGVCVSAFGGSAFVGMKGVTNRVLAGCPLAFVFAVFLFAAPARAALNQELDASIPSSVSTNGGVVTSWADQSGAGNNATPAVGSVTYPSTLQFPTGKVGLDFGSSARASLTLYSSAGSDGWLNQSVNQDGFCVLVAFKVRALTGTQSDLLGNHSSVSSTGFLLRWETSGAMRAVLGGQNLQKGGAVVAAGDTIVYAFNYNRAAGQAEFWDSKNYSSESFAVTPADFSLAAAVTLGSTTSSGRYLNGLVGEVQVYTAALSVNDFVAARQAMAQKWAGIVPPVSISWQVTPEDANYPEDDVIVAALRIGDAGFANPLPADPANQDCTATFQEAIDVVYAAGGGTVFVPAGQYRFDGNLEVKGNVHLRGQWKEPTSSQPVVGTILKVYAGSGNATGTPFLSITGSSAGVRNLSFWYPNQTASNIVAYPYTISTVSGTTMIENVTLVNSYQGLLLNQSSFLCLRGLYGSPLLVGLITDKGYALPRYDQVHLSPSYWAWSGLSGAPSVAGPQATFMLANGTGMILQEVDGSYLSNFTISGYKYGLLMEPGASGDNPGGPNAFNLVIDNCVEALRLYSQKGINAVSCTFSGSTYGAHRVLAAAGSFYSCAISGGSEAYHCDSGDQFHSVSFTNCTFNGAVSSADHESLMIVSSQFLNTGTDVILNAGTDQAIIVGNTFADGPNITDNSGTAPSLIMIDHNPVASDPIPSFPTVYTKTRKPDKDDLFIVTDAQFAGGAVGDGVADDTAAIQAAIAAAGTNAGGIVFFPFGRYRVTAPLNTGAGVELRGIHGGRHGGSPLASVIYIETGLGNPTGTPFITLGDRSGIRGLTFHYTDQHWDDVANFHSYPYMVRCQGLRNYLIDCAATNPYQAVDVDGSDEFLAEYCMFGGLKTIYNAGSGADGRIQNSHIKTFGFWHDSELPGCPPIGVDLAFASSADCFVVGANCTNLTIYSIFNHTCHTLFTQKGGTGQAMFVAGEVEQRGYIFETAPASGAFNFINCGCNTSHPGDGTGRYAWWLQSGFTGEVKLFGAGFLSFADYLLRVDNASARLVVNGLGTGQGGEWIKGVKAAGEIDLRNSDIGEKFSVEVPAGGLFTAAQCSLPDLCNQTQAGQIGYTNCLFGGSYAAADLDANPWVDRGISLIGSNVQATNAVLVFETQPQRWMWAWELSSGDTYSFHVTDADYNHGADSSVTIEVVYYNNVQQASTLTVSYDSSTGMKTGATYALDDRTGLDPVWTTKSFSVTDARLGAGDNADIKVAISGDPLNVPLNHVLVKSNYLGPFNGELNLAPTDIALSPSSVAENQASGTTVGSFSTTDPDSGDTFTYTLVTGTGSGDNASFTINGSTLKTAASFNYETKNSYSIRVRSTDQGGLYTEKAFTITVTNVNEAPMDIALSPSSVAENQASGTTVGSFTTTDPDSGNTFTYTLVTGTGSTDNASFTITAGALKTAAIFDYETKSSYSIRARSTDQGSLYTEKAFTITVTNDNEAPFFLADPLNKPAATQGQAYSQSIASDASDPDAGDTKTFSKIGGPAWLSVAANGALTGTPGSGDVGANAFTVRVTDAGALYDDATMNITVNAAATTLLTDGFETDFAKWTDGGATDWDRATDQKHAGSYSAHAGSADNDLISDNLDTTGKLSLTIEFWYRDDDIDDADDVYLQLYNGTAYANKFELGNSTEDTWLFYTVTINNSGGDAQYFRSNFRIKFEGTSIDSGENLWIDDVKVTAQ